MNKRLIMILILISVSALLFTMAPIIPPPPPPEPADCSPGFWKTHTITKYPDNRYWNPYLPGDPLPGYNISLIDALTAKGGAGSGKDLRYAAAGFLNTAPGTFCPD